MRNYSDHQSISIRSLQSIDIDPDHKTSHGKRKKPVKRQMCGCDRSVEDKDEPESDCCSCELIENSNPTCLTWTYKYERNSKVGRPSKVSLTFCRLIVRTAKKDKLSASQLVHKLRMDVPVRTVQRILQNDHFTEYVSMKARPNLSPIHRQKRLKWPREIVVKCASFWRVVTFTNEKRWCLDGTYGNNYWADTRLPRDVSSKRVNGGGDIMIRAATR